jgi:AcrR family transcriptional regulator
MTLPTRERIVEAADRLFYQQGFAHTSFSDIADVVKLSRGNFYYHFQTKDDLLAAVIERRMAETRAMIEAWEREAASPAERIKCYIRILLTNWPLIKKYGCPVGTLCAELSKLGHEDKAAATKVFNLFRDWLKEQFMALGAGEAALNLSLQVLAFSQGTATLAHSYQDKAYVENEVERMCSWVDDVKTATTS